MIYTSQDSDVTHSGQWTATSLDINIFLYIVALFFGGQCQCQCQSWIYIAHKRKASNAVVLYK